MPPALAGLECDLLESDAEETTAIGNGRCHGRPGEGKTSLDGDAILDENRRFVTGAHARTATDDESG